MGGNAAFMRIEFPDIAGVRDAHGYTLGRVNDAATTHRQYKADLFLLPEGDSLAHECYIRIGFDPAQLRKFDTFLLKAPADAPEQTAADDAPAAVMQQDFTGYHGLEVLAELEVFPWPVDVAGLIAVIEVEHAATLTQAPRGVDVK